MILNRHILQHCMDSFRRSRLAMGWSRGGFYAHLAGPLQSSVVLALFQSASFSFNYIPLRHTDECPG